MPPREVGQRSGRLELLPLPKAGELEPAGRRLLTRRSTTHCPEGGGTRVTHGSSLAVTQGGSNRTTLCFPKALLSPSELLRSTDTPNPIFNVPGHHKTSRKRVGTRHSEGGGLGEKVYEESPSSCSFVGLDSGTPAPLQLVSDALVTWVPL